jgi:hypothetical protein
MGRLFQNFGFWEKLWGEYVRVIVGTFKSKNEAVTYENEK